MKKHFIGLPFILLLLVVFTSPAFSQERAVTGNVLDDYGKPLAGASVVIKGTLSGTITDIDGFYSLSVSSGDAVLVFSFIGMDAKEEVVGARGVINVQLQSSNISLEQVLVIGYGSQKKEDATGSVVGVSEEDFNHGSIVSADELLLGKVSGVQVSAASGQPGSATQIRIRGGASLSATNDPLIVLDGVPLDNKEVKGMSNPLSSINPNDIESFTILKDASATAIYGSRASNGVIVITTKKGEKGAPLKIDYSAYGAIYTPGKMLEVLSADEFRSLVADRFGEDSEAYSLLGNANTDWQDEVYRTSFGMDHNLSLTGSYKNIPYRASVGYSDIDGILSTSEFKRTTGSIGLTPSFLEDHLKFNINGRGVFVKNRFAESDVAGNSLRIDPTQPVREDNQWGGYYTWTSGSTPNKDAPSNPVAELEQRDDRSKVSRFIGNIETVYKVHFLPDLSVHLNLGYDYSKSDGTVFIPENAAFDFAIHPTTEESNFGGTDKRYSQEKKSKLLESYLSYSKEIDKHKISAMGGYSWQHFWVYDDEYKTNALGTNLLDSVVNKTENYLISFFGRANYTYADKYLLTATLRYDGTSRFLNHWGLFPSVAFAWRMKEESFMADVDFVSNLKLRLGYGITGQQDINSGDYPAIAKYTYGDDKVQYPFGDQYITTIRPDGYDENLKWEETTTYNIGIDYGFLKNRIYGTIDYYRRETKDLINQINVPSGSNLTNRILTNVGNLENNGLEVAINGIVFNNRRDFFWEVGLNATMNRNKITKLTLTDDPSYVGIEHGDVHITNSVQIHSVGYAAGSFYVYEQVYGEDGKPIEGLYVDRNNDGIINEEDLYHYKSPAPDVYFGLSSRAQYKNWDASFTSRASFGNYLYNNVERTRGIEQDIYNVGQQYTQNLLKIGLDNGFETSFADTYKSDYFVQNASYFKLDNLSAGYTFQKLIGDKLSLRVYGTAQNVFTITSYKGLDPEVNAIDKSVYPRARTFLLGINASF